MGILSSLEDAAEKVGEMVGISSDKKEEETAAAVPAVEAEAVGTVDIAQAAPPVVNTPTAAPEPAAQTYTVQHGDTLSKISQRYYGNAHDYMKIYEANRDKLSDPDKIDVGQELTIPNA